MFSELKVFATFEKALHKHVFILFEIFSIKIWKYNYIIIVNYYIICIIWNIFYFRRRKWWTQNCWQEEDDWGKKAKRSFVTTESNFGPTGYGEK